MCSCQYIFVSSFIVQRCPNILNGPALLLFGGSPLPCRAHVFRMFCYTGNHEGINTCSENDDAMAGRGGGGHDITVCFFVLYQPCSCMLH